MERKVEIRLRLIDVDSLRAFVDLVLERNQVSLTSICTTILGYSNGHNLRNLYRGHTKDPTLKFLIELTEALPEAKQRLIPDVDFEFTYMSVISPETWKDLWADWNCLEEEFEPFAEHSGLKRSSYRNYINNHKAMATYPRLKTARCFSAYFLWKEQSLKEVFEYKKLKVVNMNPAGKKLQDIETFRSSFWEENNGTES